MSDFDDYDDLDAVRDFRTLAEPFPDVVDAAVRRRILDLAEARGLVAAAPPPTDIGVVVDAGRAPGPEPAAADGPLTAVAELRVPDRPRRPLVRLVAAAVLVALALAAGVATRRTAGTVDVEPGGDGPSGAGSVVAPTTGPGPGTSQAALGVAGLVALVAAQPDRGLGTGEFQHLEVVCTRRSDVLQPGGAEPALQTTTVEKWAAADRPGRLVSRRTTNREVAGGPGTVRRDPGDATRELPSDIAFDGWSYEGLRKLPADDAGLRAALDQRTASLGATPRAEVVLAHIVLPVVRPAVRATLWQQLAERGLQPAAGPAAAPAAAAVGTLAEAGLGGAGLAWFAFTDADGSWTVAVDRVTGALRGWERRGPGFAAVEARDVVRASEVVPASAAEVTGS